MYMYLRGCALTAIVISLSAAPACPAPPTAAEILTRVNATYLKCRSYRDTGEVVTRYKVPGGRTTVTRQPFRTWFVRPGLLRFESSEASKTGTGRVRTRRYVVWSDGRSVRSWWTLEGKVETHSSIGMALAGPTGVSGGSAHTVPRLLMPKDVQGWPITDLRDAKATGREKVSGIDCYRVYGRHPLGGTGSHTFYYSTKDYALMRIREDSDLASSVTTYAPHLNARIDRTVFQFTPPANG